MGPVSNSVFLSYRRKASQWAALAIYKDLRSHGFDVFFDYEGIASGAFDRIIIANIRSRTHFLVLLTPIALEGIERRNDWLRREIETALKTRRNIVPLMFDGFNFNSPAIARALVGPLARLKNYNALNVPPDYFDAAMERLRKKHLNASSSRTVRHPASRVARQAARTQQKQADTAPEVDRVQLKAEKSLERGFVSRNPDKELRYYTEALRLNPRFALAYYNRALVREAKGDWRAALKDYGHAIRYAPDDADAYVNRAMVRADHADLAGALDDLDRAIRLARRDADAYFNRAEVRLRKGDVAAALEDYTIAIRLAPTDADGYNNRGVAHELNGDLEQALRDYDAAVRLAPKDADAYYNRARVRRLNGDVDGALDDYGKALRLQPKYADAYYNRALIEAERGDYAAAIADYKRYLRTGTDVRDRDRKAIERIIRDLRQR